jgi:hypothetical protein
MSTTTEEPQAPDVAEDEDTAATKRAELEADISKRGKRVMTHMNADHEDTLVAYVLAFATGIEGTDPELDKEDALLRNIRKGMLTITSAQLTAVDADGFLLEIKASENTTPGKKKRGPGAQERAGPLRQARRIGEGSPPHRNCDAPQGQPQTGDLVQDQKRLLQAGP